jgi:hypothetical protein
MSQAWTSATITGINAPSCTNTASPTVTLTAAQLAQGSFVSVDITSIVQSWYQGIPNNGIVLFADAPLTGTGNNGVSVQFDSLWDSGGYPPLLNLVLQSQGPIGATGAQGPIGATGAQDPIGPTGASGISSAYSSSTGSSQVAASSSGTVASLTLPAGSYLVIAKTTLETSGGNAAGLCMLMEGIATPDETDFDLVGGGYQFPMVLMAPVTLPSQTTITFVCQNDEPSPLSSFKAVMSAVAVNQLNYP